MADDNILSFPITSLPLEAQPRPHFVHPKKVLSGAMDHADDFEIASVIGIRRDGSLFCACSSDNVADTALLMERVRNKLLSGFKGDRFA